ncbi:hypothetical protein TFLX_03099 [Thermoflexales bacterium]|nr:hypothetical protein TFLX_03099 [Thermoflexales bacterium]
MPTKTYSLKEETIQTISDLAEKTVRTQGAIIDIAVAELAKKSIDADGGVDLPVSNLPVRKIRTVKPSTRKRARARKIDQIPGLRKGVVL